MKIHTRPAARPVASLAVCLTLAPAAFAATGTWTGSAGDTWDTSATHWSGLADPAWNGTSGPTNIARFNSAAATPVVIDTIYANGILFNDTATITGGTIILAGTTPTITADADATIASLVSGTAGLVKTGAGKLTLSSDETLTGTLLIGRIADSGDMGTVTYGVDQTTGLTGISFGAGQDSNTGSTSTTHGSLDLTNANLAAGSLVVRSNSATANTILIGSGKTLSINGNIDLSSQLRTGVTNNGQNLTVSGAGTLNVSGSASTAYCRIGDNQANSVYGGKSILDLSGLPTFALNYSHASSSFRLQGGTGGHSDVANSTLTLAPTSSITAGTITIGNQGNTGTATLRLGSTSNTLRANTISLGDSARRTAGVVQFDTANGTLALLGQAGGSSRANVNMGLGAGTSTSGGDATFDVTGHTATMKISTLTMGNGTTGSAGGKIQLFKFDTGALDITSAVIGQKSTAADAVRATLQVGTSASSTGTATFGSVQIGNDGATGTFAILGGTVTMTGNITKGTTGTSASTLTLNGGTLEMGGNHIGGNGTAAANIGTLNFQSGTLKNVASINGTAGLTKTNANTLVLEGTIAYSGDTNVNDGTLRLNSINLNNESSTVTILSGAVIDIGFSGDDTVAALILGGSNVGPGSYNASHPTYGSYFSASGSGSIVVPAAAGYANWLTLHPTIADPAAGADPENDGIENVLEYVLNGNPTTSDPAILPDLAASGANFVFTFTRRAESTSDTTQIFQYGTTLTGWTNVAITGTPGLEVTLDPPSGGLQTVTVTIPKSAGDPGGKLFGRLQAVKLP